MRVGGEFAGPASAVVAAGILLYPVAKGSPDEQVSTLQPGTPWNPDGTPTAPSILPTHGAVQVLAVANQAQLAAAIETVNASPGNYAIHVTADISLNADLPALNQPLGVVRIDGEGHVLDGADTYRGLMVDDTQALLKDLTIQDAVAQGGAGGIGKAGGGGGGGGGAGREERRERGHVARHLVLRAEEAALHLQPLSQDVKRRPTRGTQQACEAT
jgi:hypothetical protein